jgi:hypothetical protein
LTWVVEQKELEIQVKELEERLDRLRTLYEQYFLGFEKLEPTVPRKDVERRFATLRKEQIRNTATRFRFNVATQKFNTYSMYWGRICRQIEEGTYKRHVARAEKRFGRAAARGKRDMDELAVDVDMAELEGADLEAVLAEADAAAAAPDPGVPDTVPPPPPPPPSVPSPALAAPISTRDLGANGNPMRPAALPPGGRGRIVLRKVAKPGVPEAPPSVRPSTREVAAPSTREVAAPSTREVAAERAPAPTPRGPMPAADPITSRKIAVATPAAPMTPRAPMQSSPDLGSQRKIIVRPRAPSHPDAGSQPRAPAAPPASAPRFPMPPPPASARKIPQAPPSTSAPQRPPPPDSEPSGQRKSVPPGPKTRVPLPSQLGRTTKKD